jgi:hypothetical protein
MSKKQASGTQSSVKQELADARASAKLICAIIRTALGEADGWVEGEHRAREQLEELDRWITGGPTPGFAERYRALLRAMDSQEPGYTRARADAAEAALEWDLNRPCAFRYTLLSLGEWAVDGQQRGLPEVLRDIVREVAECRQSIENAQHFEMACLASGVWLNKRGSSQSNDDAGRDEACRA